MDYSYNLDNRPFYPSRRVKGGVLPCIITVAASDSLGDPYKYANFSKTEFDIFAPEVDTGAAYMNDGYAAGTGSAAFIKSYCPEISSSSMRKLLMDNVTTREDAEIEKQFRPYQRRAGGTPCDRPLPVHEFMCIGRHGVALRHKERQTVNAGGYDSVHPVHRSTTGNLPDEIFLTFFQPVRWLSASQCLRG